MYIILETHITKVPRAPVNLENLENLVLSKPQLCQHLGLKLYGLLPAASPIFFLSLIYSWLILYSYDEIILIKINAHFLIV